MCILSSHNEIKLEIDNNNKKKPLELYKATLEQTNGSDIKELF
jgi:hypothetical protein